MKVGFRILLLVAAVGLTAAGCKPLDLSTQRNRIFLMGRLLAGTTCNVRVIWRKAPDAAAPASVSADLSGIGGSAAQELVPNDNSTLWRWSGQVNPAAEGEQVITVSARDVDGGRTDVSKLFRVFDTQKAIAIDAGEGITGFALMADGTVAAWDLKTGAGQDVPGGISDITAIAAAPIHRLALKTDGTVVAWGCDDPQYDTGLCDIPAGLADVVAIAASPTHSLALRADGTVAAWGKFADPVPEGLADVVAISGKEDKAAAIKGDGTLVGWPYECTLDDAAAVSAGNTIVALRSDGSIVEPLEHRLPWRMSTVRATTVSAGAGTNIALQPNGRTVAWRSGHIFHRFWDSIAVSAASRPDIFLSMDGQGRVTAWHETYVLAWEQLKVPEELR